MKVLKTETVYSGFSKIESMTIELEDGKTINREVNIRKNGVAALLFNELTGKYIFVEQFRPGSMCNTYEIPAGLLDVDGESEEDAMSREILEETGFIVDTIKEMDVPKYYNAIGSSTETIKLFFAKTSKRVNNGGGTDNENIIVHEFSADEVYKMYNDGKFMDGKTIISIIKEILPDYK